MNSTLKTVKNRFEDFEKSHRATQHDAADLIAAICDSMDLDKAHKGRVIDAFMGRQRLRIRFSDARKMLGLTDARSWHTHAARDPRFAAIEIMHDTKTSAYVWEDQVLNLLAQLAIVPNNRMEIEQ